MEPTFHLQKLDYTCFHDAIPPTGHECEEIAAESRERLTVSLSHQNQPRPPNPLVSCIWVYLYSVRRHTLVSQSFTQTACGPGCFFFFLAVIEMSYSSVRTKRMNTKKNSTGSLLIKVGRVYVSLINVKVKLCQKERKIYARNSQQLTSA